MRGSPKHFRLTLFREFHWKRCFTNTPKSGASRNIKLKFNFIDRSIRIASQFNVDDFLFTFYFLCAPKFPMEIVYQFHYVQYVFIRRFESFRGG